MAAGVIDRDRGWKRIMRDMKKVATGPHSKVGILASKGAGEAHPDDSGGSISMVGLGAVHEFGTEDIPARSWLADTLIVKNREIEAFRTKVVGKVYDGKLDPLRALGLLGEKAVALMVLRIKAGIAPPLKPATIVKKTVAGKKGTTPLINEGHLWRAIAQEVKAR